MPKKELVIAITEIGCHECVSHTPNQDGYIRIWHPTKKRQLMLHRTKWEEYHRQDIPDGFEIDHLCKNRKCCNPDHLRLIDRSRHKTIDNGKRYAEVLKEAKSIWNKNPSITGTELAAMFDRCPSIGCRWIRNWKRDIDK